MRKKHQSTWRVHRNQSTSFLSAAFAVWNILTENFIFLDTKKCIIQTELLKVILCFLVTSLSHS